MSSTSAAITDLMPILVDVKERLAEHFGSRFSALLLYGSRARDDWNDESDVDLMVLLNDVESVGRDLEEIWCAAYPVQLQYPDLQFSFRPVDAASFARGEWALYRAAKREGIRV